MHPNGYIMHKLPFINDKLNGIQEHFYENGDIKQKTPFVNDITHGI